MFRPKHVSFGEDTLRFHCLEHSSFHFYCSTSVLFFKYCVYLLFSAFILVQKLLVLCMQKGRLFRLLLRLYHVMLDIILIISLVVIVVAWLVSNNWECLMCLWKNHALFLSYRSIILWYSLLMLYLGWLGACLHHVWL
jgi:hypothetical protein